MGRDGLLIGEVAKRSGASCGCTRQWASFCRHAAHRRVTACMEATRSTCSPSCAKHSRSASRWMRIKEIVGIKRAGLPPCPHVHDLIRRKAEELDQRLSDLMTVRDGLLALPNDWRRAGKAGVGSPSCLNNRLTITTGMRWFSNFRHWLGRSIKAIKVADQQGAALFVLHAAAGLRTAWPSRGRDRGVPTSILPGTRANPLPVSVNSASRADSPIPSSRRPDDIRPRRQGA